MVAGALTANAPGTAASEHRSEWARIAASVRRNRGAMIGLAITLLLVAVGLLAPVLSPYDPTGMGVGKRLEAPSSTHLFGTDKFGRDLFSRVVAGTRLTLFIGAVAVGISCTVGSLLGLLSGYFGGWADNVIMRLVDVMFSFPDILIALSVVALLGPSLRNAVIAVGISAIPWYARLIRGTVLVEQQKQYFEAAQSLGASHLRLIGRHILPNALPPILVLATLGFSTAVLSAAALSFLGLGAQPPTPEWGLELALGRDLMRQAWWIMTFPGLAIAITVLGFNLLGDGLREALDPRQRRVG
ncbi:MAG: ABC transporter permease [Chloroflexota bacterium]|nr:ABC transporter permease [Chloroflexota bacterium]